MPNVKINVKLQTVNVKIQMPNFMIDAIRKSRGEILGSFITNSKVPNWLHFQIREQ